ncbi:MULTISPECIES: TetR/AcrR family transcriptional regulator [Leptospira]|uniref:TetR/AcrR family transcriptional regulator n=2 Tax=Leptospira TaxID=171 RepID=A0A5F2BYW7_9LEPT|nr:MULTISPECIES: TetR/AcrR family transcriptional regulator [Leptospira]PKA17785.1 TetR family transcriptional regulator [Leptospira haakeii]PKA21510.1 TetR family transcriptional regulator [Leptospira haakeii]TGM16089.1 TetR/AcrR family transcriptional regulator [Leptospira selangorensis]TGM17960.1 TetR/AcrR family transcriptional regulator [Leptospira selangorensis]
MRTKPPSPIANRAEARREQILEAALDVFSEKGYHEAGIADIAGKLNIGHGTCYRYFKNKLDILHALVDRILLGLLEVVRKESPEKSNSIEEYRNQIKNIGWELFQLFSKDPRQAKIVFFEAMALDETVKRKVQLGIDKSARLTELYLKNGVKKGFLRKELDTRIASQAVNAMMFEGIRINLSSKVDSKFAKRWLEEMPTLMLEGMGKR